MNTRTKMSANISKVLTRLGLAFTLFVVGLMFIVYPTWRRAEDMRAQEAELNEQIRKQQSYAPAYLRMKSLIDKLPTSRLPVPSGDPLPLDFIGNVPSMLESIGVASGLEVLDANMDAASLRKNPGKLEAQAVYFGSPKAFSLLMTKLNGLPALSEIKKIGMRAVPSGVEIMVQVVLTVNMPGSKG